MSDESKKKYGNRVGDWPLNRRNFLKISNLYFVGGTVALVAGGVPLISKIEKPLLRPPGSLAEHEFLAICIKCGQCLQVCPVKAIKLGGIMDGFSLGTPYIKPRESACILEKAFVCGLACPTGAIGHIVKRSDAKMGKAEFTGKGRCLSAKGINDAVFILDNLSANSSSNHINNPLKNLIKRMIIKLEMEERSEWKEIFKIKEFPYTEEKTGQVAEQIASRIDNKSFEWLKKFAKRSAQAKTACRVCLEECPIKQSRPIIFKAQINPVQGNDGFIPVVQDNCVGCGVCEMKCPTKEASIKVKPRNKGTKRS